MNKFIYILLLGTTLFATYPLRAMQPETEEGRILANISRVRGEISFQDDSGQDPLPPVYFMRDALGTIIGQECNLKDIGQVCLVSKFCLRQALPILQSVVETIQKSKFPITALHLPMPSSQVKYASLPIKQLNSVFNSLFSDPSKSYYMPMPMFKYCLTQGSSPSRSHLVEFEFKNGEGTSFIIEDKFSFINTLIEWEDFTNWSWAKHKELFKQPAYTSPLAARFFDRNFLFFWPDREQTSWTSKFWAVQAARQRRLSTSINSSVAIFNRCIANSETGEIRELTDDEAVYNDPSWKNFSELFKGGYNIKPTGLKISRKESVQ